MNEPQSQIKQTIVKRLTRSRPLRTEKKMYLCVYQTKITQNGISTLN